jgi:membrane associated rhomboid family serine protease
MDSSGIPQEINITETKESKIKNKNGNMGSGQSEEVSQITEAVRAEETTDDAPDKKLDQSLDIEENIEGTALRNLTEETDDAFRIGKMEGFTKSPLRDNKNPRYDTAKDISMWPTSSDGKNRLEAAFEAFDSNHDEDARDSFVDAESAIPLEKVVPRVMTPVAIPVTLPVPPPNQRTREKPAGAPRSSPKRATTPRSTNNELIRHLNRSELILNKADDEMSPALIRRLRDFAFAQQKRTETYGERNPWGIIGLYDHLTGIRTDIEWAEDAAWRREQSEPYLSWSDFEGAKDTGLNQPFFTYIVMVLCTVCLILSIGVNGWSVEPLTVNPMIGPSAQTLIDVGAKKTSLIVNEGQWYRLFSPMVLHAGIIHFVLNMLALWFIGYAVEMSHGFLTAAILFIIPAIGGTIMSALFLPEYISVGASGGIFGLIGGCIADIVTNWNLLFSKEVNHSEGSRFRNVKVLIWLLLDILLNILIGLTPFVDNFTHLGGMVYGFLCGLSKLERLSTAFFGVQKGLLSRLQSSLVRFFGLTLSIICIIITTFVLAKSEGKRIANCPGCRYVSCVPFPFWSDYDDKWWYCDDCDLVEADARHSTVTNLYSSMTMTCPDGDSEFIDLSGSQISDPIFLQKQLPKYCRDYCDHLFAD